MPVLSAFLAAAVWAESPGPPGFGQGEFADTPPAVSIVSIRNFQPASDESERLLAAALRAQEEPSALPTEKADAWCSLGDLKEENPYADQARSACEQWAAYDDILDQARRRCASDLEALALSPGAVDAFLKAYEREARLWPSVFSPFLDAAAKAKENLRAGRPSGLKASQPRAKSVRPRGPRPYRTRPIEWIPIPGGRFRMGSRDYRQLVHEVRVRPFLMAKTPVTNHQYGDCVAAGACSPPDPSCLTDGFQEPDQPVVCVTWEQAASFSRWAGGRLPSEAEWEYAARSAGRDWLYPWGNQEADCRRAVISDPAHGCGIGSPWPVCSKPRGLTRQGLCDMAGNVWEWVQDWSHGTYRGAPDDGRAWEEPGPGSFRMYRGGSWDNGPRFTRSARRPFYGPGPRDNAVGFRPVKP